MYSSTCAPRGVSVDGVGPELERIPLEGSLGCREMARALWGSLGFGVKKKLQKSHGFEV